jgi:PAS domain S-box-containing protein
MPPAESAASDSAAARREPGLASVARASFEQSPVALFLLSADGVVRAANPAASRLVSDGQPSPIGQPLWDLVEALGSTAGAEWIRGAVAAALAANATAANATGPPLEHDIDFGGQDRTINWSVHSARDAGDGIVAVAVARDVTVNRNARAGVELVGRLALALHQTESLEAALSECLKTICEAAGGVLGEAWLPVVPAATNVRLARTGVWAHPDHHLQSFVAQGSGFEFAAGEGLPGMAWERRKVIWANPLTGTEDFTRVPLARIAGLHAALAIPLLVHGVPVAVISCYLENAPVQATRPLRVAQVVSAEFAPLLEQRRASEARREIEAQLAGTIAIALEAIISIDDNRRITLFNWGAERIFGYTAEEALGQSLDMLLPEEVRARHAAMITQFSRSAETARRLGERSAIVGRRKNGDVFPAEASICRYMTGNRWTFTVMLRDTTGHRRAEENLRFLAEVGTVIADLMNDPSALQRAAERAVPMLGDSCIIDLVEGAQILTGAVAARDASSAAGIRADRDANPPRWDVVTPVIEALRDRRPVLWVDGTRTVCTPGAPVPDHPEEVAAPNGGSLLVVPLEAHGQMVGTATFVMEPGGRTHDPSSVALAEAFGVRLALAVDSAALYQRTRGAISARDEALAVVSHDLRNPLTAIALCAAALRESPPPSTFVMADLLATIAESATLMKRIIQDLLDVASIDAGRLSLERRLQPLVPVIERACGMFREAAADAGVGLELDRRGLDQLPEAYIDAERILQVLASLLNNALKFTKSGGFTTVSVARHADRITVMVRDTGAGIAPADLPNVFERFWHERRNARIHSTGLGLAIARGIVEAHGGRIAVRSELGHGSTFLFDVPVPYADPSRSASGRVPVAAPGP